MYFWNYTRLAILLQGEGSTPSYYKGYCTFFLLLCFLLVHTAVSQVLVPHMYAIASFVVFVVSIAAWLTLTYSINQKGDGSNYINRLVCLNLPATVRSIVTIVIIMVITTFILKGYVRAHFDPTGDINAVMLAMQAFNAKLNLALLVMQQLVFLYWSAKAFAATSHKEVFVTRGAVL